MLVSSSQRWRSELDTLQHSPQYARLLSGAASTVLPVSLVTADEGAALMKSFMPAHSSGSPKAGQRSMSDMRHHITIACHAPKPADQLPSSPIPTSPRREWGWQRPASARVARTRAASGGSDQEASSPGSPRASPAAMRRPLSARPASSSSRHSLVTPARARTYSPWPLPPRISVEVDIEADAEPPASSSSSPCNGAALPPSCRGSLLASVLLSNSATSGGSSARPLCHASQHVASPSLLRPQLDSQLDEWVSSLHLEKASGPRRDPAHNPAFAKPALQVVTIPAWELTAGDGSVAFSPSRSPNRSPTLSSKRWRKIHTAATFSFKASPVLAKLSGGEELLARASAHDEIMSLFHSEDGYRSPQATYAALERFAEAHEIRSTRVRHALEALAKDARSHRRRRAFGALLRELQRLRFVELEEALTIIQAKTVVEEETFERSTFKTWQVGDELSISPDCISPSQHSPSLVSNRPGASPAS